MKMNEALTKLLTDEPGSVSIKAGIAVLRALGADAPEGELQSIVGTFAAERGRAVRFDRTATKEADAAPPSATKAMRKRSKKLDTSNPNRLISD
ncbi:hypothetical protein [Mesorhizobium sp. J8]|uniref:hypothetical protein n=1 Tax=Mesorhizobium sp. J8 TaxID=2777475 RepID=UPI001915F951|nr:hypothetical protein [Mesorhizobium sp. J8]BCM19288.1 hypothetical protein MJ8_30610 [Mesorhizobium sp. J8]